MIPANMIAGFIEGYDRAARGLPPRAEEPPEVKNDCLPWWAIFAALLLID